MINFFKIIVFFSIVNTPIKKNNQSNSNVKGEQKRINNNQQIYFVQFVMNQKAALKGLHGGRPPRPMRQMITLWR